MRPLRAMTIATVLLAGATPATAFSPITEESNFVTIVSGKELTRFGIRLNVMPDGLISGRAFGKTVSGAWRWTEGYFCRDLYFGETDLGPNCQAVKIDGGTIRFIADEGAGDHADFALKQR